MTGTAGVGPSLASSMAPITRGAGLVLLAILAGALVLRLFYFIGCIGSDDMAAWHLAWRLAQGDWPPEVLQNPVASARYGFILPLALFLKVTGSGEGRVFLYPLLMSMAGIVATWDATRRLTGRLASAHLAALLVAVCGLEIEYTTQLLPDAAMAAWTVIAVWAGIMALDAPRPRATTGWLVLAGVVASWVIFHKLAGAQLALALALWGATLLAHRELRVPVLLCGGAVVVGIGLEHLFFWALHGDPWYRWITVEAATARVLEFRLAHDPEAALLSSRLAHWAHQLVSNSPGALVYSMTAMLAAAVLVRASLKDAKLRLLVLFTAVLVAMRGLEATQTFSYQPRRLLPFVHLAAILVPVLLMRWPLSLRWPRALPAVLAVGALALLVDGDGMNIRKQRTRLHAERWLAHWTEDHAAEVRQSQLFTDPRTLVTLWVLRGFPDLGGMGIHPIPGYEGTRDFVRGSGPIPEDFPEGSLLFENSRVVQWLVPRLSDREEFQLFIDLPDLWQPVQVIAHPWADASNSGLLRRIEQPAARRALRLESVIGSPSDARTDHAWRLRSVRALADGRVPLRALADGWVRFSWEEGGERDLVTTRPLRPSVGPGECEAGTPLVLVLPLRRAAGSDKVIVKVELFGVAADGQATSFHRQRFQVQLEEQQLRAYAVVPAFVGQLHGLRATLRLSRPGSVDIGAAQVLIGPDAGATDPAPGGKRP